MLNKPKNEECNDLPDQALLEVEDKINKSKAKSEPASSDFKESLKAKILEKRHQKFSMDNLTSPVKSFFTVKRLAPIVAGVVIVAVVLTTMHFWPVRGPGPDGELPPFAKFSKLLINSAYAHDNFEVEATSSDSLGVESNTAFIIKSKDEIDPDLLLESISLVPEVDFDFEKINDHEFKITPRDSLEQKQVYQLQIASAYVDEAGITVERDYSWAFQVKEQFKVLHTLPANRATNVPLDTGIEVTFSHANFASYESAVKIEPQIAGRFEKHKRTLVFVPKNLEAGAIYTVTVSKELPILGSDFRLEEDYVFQFETDPSGGRRGVSWNFGFNEDFSEFSTSQEPALEVYKYGFEGTDFPTTIYSFTSLDQFIGAINKKDKIPYWARYSRGTYTYDTSGLNSVASFDLAMTEYGYSGYLVLPGNLPRGYYLAETEVNGKISQTLFQVNDLAVFSTVTTTDTLVWVNDLRTKAPVGQAKVEVLGTGLSQTTDSEGIAKFNTSSFYDFELKNLEDRYYYTQEYYLKVSQGSEAGIIPLNVRRHDSNDYWYYFYKDRGIYKPNDKIDFWGFLKSRQGEKITDELSVRLLNYNYRNYYHKPTLVTETKASFIEGNSFTGNLVLDNVTPGYYTLELILGDKTISSEYFRVETYTKPAYELEITPAKKAIFAGENIVAKVKAQFFEGTPVADLDLTYKYEKGQEEKTRTDDLGEVELVLPTEYRDCSRVKSCSYPEHQSLSVRPTRAEEGEITKRASLMVFGPQVKANVSLEQTGDAQGKIITKVNKVDFSRINSGEETIYGDYLGEPAPGLALEANITEISYDKHETGEYYDFINKIVRKQYKYTRRESNLGEYTGVTDKEGEHTYELAMEEGKSYQVRVVVADGQGKYDGRTAYFYTQQPGAWDYDRYYLKLEDQEDSSQSEFSVDEPVGLEFVKNEKALPQGNNNFLYYQLRQGLSDYEVKGDPFYSFQFTKEHIPNVYVRGVFFDGRSYHVNYSGWSMGGGSGTLIKYKSEDRQLNISVETDKEKYVHGEDVTLNVKVTDSDGQPVVAHLNLNLVDEAFYALSPEKVDTLGELYKRVDGGELVLYQSHEAPALSAGAEGGGCFAAGTKIKMADGSQKNIEEIGLGDQILTFENEHAKRLVEAEVIETFDHLVPEYWVINGHLKVTPEHRVFVNNGWQMIGEARVGDYLVDDSGQLVRIESIERVRELVKVYNFHVEDYHTYIANGLYVHNDKGGPREHFLDTALFKAMVTDRSGEAQVTFTLPDNLTSWRVTSQAISEDLYAGSAVSPIKVSLPVFIESSFAADYVVSDKPTVKMRAYGDELQSGEKVDFTLDAPTLGINELSQEGEAFRAEYADIHNLTEGIHKISSTVERGEDKDTVIKSVKVSRSRLTEGQQKFYEVREGLQVQGSADSRTTLVFSDKNQGQFYNRLRRLGWTGGDRIDQKLSRALSDELRKKYFGEEVYLPEEVNGQLYQLPDGGISLLPYSEAEFELSAKIAAIASEHFDQNNLANYFYKILISKDSTQEEVGVALFGLASLEESVLVQVQAFAALPDLTVEEQLYIALAAHQLGDSELARKIYLEVMDSYGEELDPYVRLNIGDDQDDILTVTSLAAILAGGLNDEHHLTLWQYVQDNYTKDILVNLEELMYISQTLPHLKPGEVSLTVLVSGKKTDISLDKGETYHMSVTPEELASIDFANINGAVGLVSTFEVSAQVGHGASQEVSVRRAYYVNGVQTNNFKENDLVQVRIYPSISATSLDGGYQVTDLLPSGLKIITKLYDRGIKHDTTLRYPYEINGQKIKFSWWKNSRNSSFTYYARVVAPGEYMAEPVVIQSMKSATVKSYSAGTQVIIEK